MNKIPGKILINLLISSWQVLLDIIFQTINVNMLTLSLKYIAYTVYWPVSAYSGMLYNHKEYIRVVSSEERELPTQDLLLALPNQLQ